MHLREADKVLMRLEQLGLRHFSVDDLEALFELESDSFLKQYVGGPVTAPRSEWLKSATQLPHVPYQFALVYLPSNTFAGRATLDHYEAVDCREIQVILRRQFVGGGFGRVACSLACNFAFQVLGANKVVGIVDPQHRASLNLVKALAFYEGPPVVDANGVILKRTFELARGA